jgi:hypothetical protein
LLANATVSRGLPTAAAPAAAPAPMAAPAAAPAPAPAAAAPMARSNGSEAQAYGRADRDRSATEGQMPVRYDRLGKHEIRGLSFRRDAQLRQHETRRVYVRDGREGRWRPRSRERKASLIERGLQAALTTVDQLKGSSDVAGLTNSKNCPRPLTRIWPSIRRHLHDRPRPSRLTELIRLRHGHAARLVRPYHV